MPRNKVSPNDPRTAEQLATGGMIGGDRMLHHGYAKHYSKGLMPFLTKDSKPVIAEFGILKGNGLAIWCELFKHSRVLGFDIDLQHISKNRAYLESRGAFESNQPELHEYDQFLDNVEYLGKVLDGDKIDICIDDGFHSNESILMTIQSVAPYLSEKFIYIVEDNADVHKEIRRIYPDYIVINDGEITLMSNA